jgi:hypothetical protein
MMVAERRPVAILDERRTRRPVAQPRVRKPLPQRGMERWECGSCGAMLMEVQLRKGRIRVKCKCNAWNTLIAV